MTTVGVDIFYYIALFGARDNLLLGVPDNEHEQTYSQLILA